jgi:hypothetical protein
MNFKPALPDVLRHGYEYGLERLAEAFKARDAGKASPFHDSFKSTIQ